MSAQLDPRVHVEWVVAPVDDLNADWQHVACCAAPAPAARQSADPRLLAGEDDDEWWPGRCI